MNLGSQKPDPDSLRVCDECGSVVPMDQHGRHQQWHQKVEQRN
jgi:hypothetical protein